MNTTRRTAYRTLVLTGLAAALAGTTACSGVSLPGVGEHDKTTTYTFDDMLDGDARQVLPSWVPASATAITEIQRTTGDERIFTLTLDEELPAQCVAVGTVGEPTEEEIEAGLAAGSDRSATEISQLAELQHRTPLLEADWWPAGQEKRTTHLCGKWWVAQEEGTVYAFTPETRVVAEGVLGERESSR